MRRLALNLAISILLTLPALAQRSPNTNSSGGSNAGGGESRETVASPRESGGGYSGGGYTGGGSASSGGGSREPSPSRDTGSANSGGGGSVSSGGGSAPAGGARTPAVSPRGDPGDRDFNSRSHGKPVGVPVQPGAPVAKLPANAPVTPAKQPAGNHEANTAPVPAPPSNPCFGGSQVNGQCVSCGAGGTLTNGRCFVCPSGQVDEGGLCHVRCEGNTLWNGIDCVGYPLGPEYGYRPSGEMALPRCSHEEQSLDDDNARRRDLEGRAARVCLFDPLGMACQGLALQVDGIKQEIGRDWRALDRCRHGL